MPYYEAATVTTIVTATAGTVIAAFRAGSKVAHLRELHLWAQTAPVTDGQLYLARSTAIGTGGTTGVSGSARDPDASIPTAGGQIVTAWGGAAPTHGGPTTALRRLTVSASIGVGLVWTWYEEQGLFIPDNTHVNAELCLVNAVALAPGTWALTAVFQE